MNKNMKTICRDVQNGKNLEVNLPQLFNRLITLYEQYAEIKLTMHYYTFYENYMESPVVRTLGEEDILKEFNTILKDFLGSPKLEINTKTNQRISFKTVKNVMSNEVNYVTVNLPAKASVIGEDENNKLPVAWKVETENNGSLIFLGIKWQHQMREHIRMMDEVLTDLGI